MAQPLGFAHQNDMGKRQQAILGRRTQKADESRVPRDGQWAVVGRPRNMTLLSVRGRHGLSESAQGPFLGPTGRPGTWPVQPGSETRVPRTRIVRGWVIKSDDGSMVAFVPVFSKADEHGWNKLVAQVVQHGER